MQLADANLSRMSVNFPLEEVSIPGKCTFGYLVDK
jgi:hypothetical protein